MLVKKVFKISRAYPSGITLTMRCNHSLSQLIHHLIIHLLITELQTQKPTPLRAKSQKQRADKLWIDKRGGE
jgi:hypothetical protein